MGRRKKGNQRNRTRLSQGQQSRSSSALTAETFNYFEQKGGFVFARRRKSTTKRKLRERRHLFIKMGNAMQTTDVPESLRKEVLDFDCSTKKILDKLKAGEYPKVLVMAGAGISVSCGIPDFRSPGTGLYDNLQRFNLPTPESVFELDYFQETKGEAFYKLAKEMWPSNFAPSPTHMFIRLLHDKGLLSTCYSQNIDTLERKAGIPDDKVIEAHGSFASAHCTKCNAPFDSDVCKEKILSGNTPIRCTKAGCGGLVKPAIVFFGEDLPMNFKLKSPVDAKEADLLIIMGTSLSVYPFAGLVDMVAPTCPRLLLNMKPVGLRIPDPNSSGLRLRQAENYRDAMVQGECDLAVRAICDYLGWRDELETLVEQVGSKSVADRTVPVNVEEAFPTMTPGGLAYNWRAGTEVTPDLPELTSPILRPEAVDIEEIEELAVASGNGAALVAFEEFTDVYPGGSIGAMLCLANDAHENWETFHVLALVNSKTQSVNFSSIRNSEVLLEPMHKEGENDDDGTVSFHQVAFQIPPDEEGSLEVWYVDTSKGVVSHRWGPYHLKGAEESRNLEHNVQLEQDLDGQIGEIIDSMGDLPADLRESILQDMQNGQGTSESEAKNANDDVSTEGTGTN
mmetsp:Transcript_20067/g.37296  ORF Transcript_20067/g.37296 Transcript_20067/m.37296 type:complete len:623 (-) Transcript_20067:13-1881(-)